MEDSDIMLAFKSSNFIKSWFFYVSLSYMLRAFRIGFKKV
jgi:hypothetical protein